VVCIARRGVCGIGRRNLCGCVAGVSVRDQVAAAVGEDRGPGGRELDCGERVVVAGVGGEARVDCVKGEEELFRWGFWRMRAPDGSPCARSRPDVLSKSRLLISRLLPANIFNLFSKRGFSEKCYSFPVGFLFHEKNLRFPLRSFEFGRCGKSNKSNRSSSEICPRAQCAGHSTKHQS
jgi:hypothetical protein